MEQIIKTIQDTHYKFIGRRATQEDLARTEGYKSGLMTAISIIEARMVLVKYQQAIEGMTEEEIDLYRRENGYHF